jgi:hypothetical protein
MGYHATVVFNGGADFELYGALTEHRKSENSLFCPLLLVALCNSWWGARQRDMNFKGSVFAPPVNR